MKHKHDWHWESRNFRTELWEVCQMCGEERRLRIVHIEPLKGGSCETTKKGKMGTGTRKRIISDFLKTVY